MPWLICEISAVTVGVREPFYVPVETESGLDLFLVFHRCLECMRKRTMHAICLHRWRRGMGAVRRTSQEGSQTSLFLGGSVLSAFTSWGTKWNQKGSCQRLLRVGSPSFDELCKRLMA